MVRLPLAGFFSARSPKAIALPEIWGGAGGIHCAAILVGRRMLISLEHRETSSWTTPSVRAIGSGIWPLSATDTLSLRAVGRTQRDSDCETVKNHLRCVAQANLLIANLPEQRLGIRTSDFSWCDEDKLTAKYSERRS